jgi:hypothetical protein
MTRSLCLCALLAVPAAAQPPLALEGAFEALSAGVRAEGAALGRALAARPAPAPVPAAPSIEVVEFTAFYDRMPGIIGLGAPSDPRVLTLTLRVSNPGAAPVTARLEEAALSFSPLSKGAAVTLTAPDGSAALGVDRAVPAGGSATIALRGRGVFAHGRDGDRLRATLTFELGGRRVVVRASTVVSEAQ